MSAFSNESSHRPKNRRALRAIKRAEAVERNAKANAKTRQCGHVHGDAAAACTTPAVSR